MLRLLRRYPVKTPVSAFQPRFFTSKVSEFNASSIELNEHTNRPLPLNVKLLQHEPIKLEPTHGDLVGKLTVSSFISLRDVQFLSDFLLRAAFYLGIPAKGPTPKTKNIERWTVIRGPFAHAKSKQNFERITYSREIKLFDADPEVVQLLFAIAAKHTMAGVTVLGNAYVNDAFNPRELESIQNINPDFNQEVVNQIKKYMNEGNDEDLSNILKELETGINK